MLKYPNLSQMINPVDHLETPTTHFQTNVYTLSNDGWSDWPASQAAYLGRDRLGTDPSGPNPLADTTLDTVASKGMTDYYNFAKLSPEQLAVDIFHAGQNIGDFPTSWGEIGTWFDDLVGLPTTEAGWMADIDSFVGTL